MKKPTDDLEKLEGKFIPFYIKVLITIITAVITFVIFYFFQRLF